MSRSGRTRLIFATTAIAMIQCLQDCSSYTHLIIDEVHIRHWIARESSTLRLSCCDHVVGSTCTVSTHKEWGTMENIGNHNLRRCAHRFPVEFGGHPCPERQQEGEDHFDVSCDGQRQNRTLFLAGSGWCHPTAIGFGAMSKVQAFHQIPR